MYSFFSLWLSRNNVFLIGSSSSNLSVDGCLEWGVVDAGFMVDLKGRKLQGFYMLELKVKNASSSMSSSLDINKSVEFKLPIRSNGCFKRICYFPEKVESISWIPLLDSGSVESVEMVFKKVTKGFAVSRMLKKLKKKEIEGNLHDLMLEYDSYFEDVSYIVNSLDLECGKDLFYLAGDGLSGLTKREEVLSRENQSWIKENKAISFFRHSNGKIERLDE